MYYKVVQPNGRSFLDSDYQWIPKKGDPTGITIACSPSDTALGLYPYASTAVANCIGMKWPCRLIELRPLTPVMEVNHPQMSTLYQAYKWQVVRELPAVLAFGPRYQQVMNFFTMLTRLDPTRYVSSGLTEDGLVDVERLRSAYGQLAQDEHRYAAWCAVTEATWRVCDIRLMNQLASDQIGLISGAVLLEDLIELEPDYLALRAAWDAATSPQEGFASQTTPHRPEALTAPPAPLLSAAAGTAPNV